MFFQLTTIAIVLLQLAYPINPIRHKRAEDTLLRYACARKPTLAFCKQLTPARLANSASTQVSNVEDFDDEIPVSKSNPFDSIRTRPTPKVVNNRPQTNTNDRYASTGQSRYSTGSGSRSGYNSGYGQGTYPSAPPSYGTGYPGGYGSGGYGSGSYGSGGYPFDLDIAKVSVVGAPSYGSGYPGGYGAGGYPFGLEVAKINIVGAPSYGPSYPAGCCGSYPGGYGSSYPGTYGSSYPGYPGYAPGYYPGSVNIVPFGISVGGPNGPVSVGTGVNVGFPAYG